MQLKKIEIQGFKSFADKTEIVFLEGITTIVGPNGSGKSNISDAVRWVLGEQSVKTLRGSKMEDVIFAGTQARKKVGFAEVSMYLDNSDGSLPVDYNEVVVTRRVYRTGESNYLINGSECRLKDVQELFMDTGVGRDGYSIISQGKIDEILSTKSEERRHIFEEASGIVKYRTRKEEATRKLANTETTLTRVHDILNEIENVIGPLEKSAQKAKEYLNLREKLKILDVKIFIDRLQKNAIHLSELDDMIETFSRDIEVEEKTSVEMEKAKLNLKERFQEVSLKIEQTKEKYYTLEKEAEKLNSKISVNEEKMQSSQDNITRLEEELKEDSEKITLLKEEIEKRMEKRKSMSENKKKFEEELAQKEQQLNSMMATLDQKGLQIERLKETIDEANETKYELKADISSMEATIEANEKQREEKIKQKERHLSQKDSVSAAKNDIYVALNEKTKLLKDVEDKVAAYEQQLQQENEKVVHLKDEESKLKQEMMTLRSKHHYLVNLEQENEGYYKSVKSALEYAKEHKMTQVYGTVASLISTEEKYEYAIEIALGGYLQNIVVQNEKQATEIISYLKTNKLGRVTFLPLENLRSVSFDIKSKISQLPGYIGVAAELVKYDKQYERAIHLALNNTIVVDTIDHAVSISKKMKTAVRFVTLAGELIAPSGSLTGGQAAHKSAGLIGRTEKIEELKTKLELKEKELTTFQTQVSHILKQQEKVKEELTQLRSQKDNRSIEVATLKEKYENIKREENKLESTNEASLKVIGELEQETEELKERMQQAQQKIATIDQDMEAKQQEIDEYARINKESAKDMDYLNEDVVNLKISLSSFDESVASIDEMKEKIEQDIENFEAGRIRKREQIEALTQNITACQEDIVRIQEEIKKQNAYQQEYVTISEELKQNREDCLAKQDILEVKMLESVKKVEKLKEEKAKVESRKVKYDIEIENLKNKMWEDYELTLSSAKALVESLPEEEKADQEIVKKAEKIRKEIKALGEVNVGAIEEYQTTKERYDFISHQREDLEQTKNKLNNLINNMTSIMKQQFSKQFKIITENFNETFQELFGGGKADLKLSDESNVLESGIEIEVQPPGKKLQSMMLLSGGERALTATALLFAILKIKSPPFCILDEIEAALDDVNVHRFAEYIKKYSKATQFIVITHRKGTMEVASSTYGVTMQEYGISKIISMKLR